MDVMRYQSRISLYENTEKQRKEDDNERLIEKFNEEDTWNPNQSLSSPKKGAAQWSWGKDRSEEWRESPNWSWKKDLVHTPASEKIAEWEDMP